MDLTYPALQAFPLLLQNKKYVPHSSLSSVSNIRTAPAPQSCHWCNEHQETYMEEQLSKGWPVKGTSVCDATLGHNVFYAPTVTWGPLISYRQLLQGDPIKVWAIWGRQFAGYPADSMNFRTDLFSMGSFHVLDTVHTQVKASACVRDKQ